MVQPMLAEDSWQRACEEGVEKGPNQSCVDHRWRASTLESCGDIKVTRSWSSHWYMTSDLLLLCIFLIFDYNHQGVPRVLCSGGLV